MSSITPEDDRDYDAIHNSIIEEAKKIRESLGMDSVQIIVTWPDTKDHAASRICFGGSGSYYARVQSCREYVALCDTRCDEQGRQSMREDK